MRFKFRIGPFTFGRSGTRFSLWSGGVGISIPLSKKKGRTFGKISVGSVSGYFGNLYSNQDNNKTEQKIHEKKLYGCTSEELKAIKAFGLDYNFLNKLRKKGVPWRGVQEHIKMLLPEYLQNRDDMAYKLVPKTMNTVFGQQHIVWKTEKRPAKNSRGLTTWIVIINNSD